MERVIDIPDPYSCGLCGTRRHGLGDHPWVRPMNYQVLARMRARKAKREETRGMRKTYTMTSTCDDGVTLGDTVFEANGDDAAKRAALGVAKGYSRHNGHVTWALYEGTYGPDVPLSTLRRVVR